MNDLHSYTYTLEDDFETETVTERIRSVPFTEAEIRLLDKLSAALGVLGCASLAVMLDAKVRLWREQE